ncbi:hypothetical protein EES43_14960 [Streptomyces sp. ADI96-02]|nr:hypothetical protein EES43_14960 [Streptomyces sp. ADI96-02]
MRWFTVLAGAIAATGLTTCLVVQIRKLITEVAEVIRSWREVRKLLRRR